ncbi:NAD(P)H-binding protein [Hyphomicrobium sp.]|uniref:NAD(P)H-binding protein n=1 Tax=Hyphomicrobium sp. TaxID=82 RepID=UPI0025BACADC|nr:NAD(P)H-binding protein [Hyphomicrobium sp.]MCC7254080.1 NAD(P)H-binding protein [Hyphomicrobium sp.]
MPDNPSSDVLLVTGAAGQLGRRVLANLLDVHGVAPQRLVAVTRDPAKLADVAARGVAVRRGDCDDPATLAPAFSGAHRLLLISTNVIDRPGVRVAQHKAAVAAAEAAGVAHVVYTSMPRPDRSVIPFAPDHLATEQALASSPLGWTVLRNAWYCENLGFTLPSVLASGQWFTSAGDGRVAYITREDCARVAAAALIAHPAENAIHEITGPAALTTAETAATIGDVLGVPMAVVQVSDEELVQGMIGAGSPEPMARIWASFDSNTQLGNFDIVTDAVERLTGRPPETLRAHFTANKAAYLPAGAGATT